MIRKLLMLMFTLFLVGCNSSEDSSPPADPVVTAIRIVSSADEMVAGDRTQLNAWAVYNNGDEKNITGSAVWQSDTPSVLTVQEGFVETLAQGTAVVSAVWEKHSAEHTINVKPKPIVVTGVRLSAEERVVMEGDVVAWSAFADFSDDSELDITEIAEWNSDNTSVASVAKGIISGHVEGQAAVSVSYEGYTSSLTIDVEPIPVTVTGIALDAVDTPIVEGESVTWRAVARLSNEESIDISRLAEWYSEVDSVAGVIRGVISGHRTGMTNITVKYDGYTASRMIEVEPKPITVESVAFYGSVDNLRVGESATLTAMGTYSDGEIRDVSRKGLWHSSSVSQLLVSDGVLQARDVGAVEIHFELEGHSASMIVDVLTDEPSLLSVRIEGDDAPITAGERRQFRVVASYDNETDLTVIGDWQSENEAVIAIDAAGFASGIEPGVTSINVAYESLSASLLLEVERREPVAQGITIVGDTSRFRKGDFEQLQAWVDYDNGETEDITTEATWLTSALDIATVTHGLIEGIEEGDVVISAQWEELTSERAVVVYHADITELVPNIFDNIMTMKEGEIHDGTFRLVLSDGSVEDYSDVVAYVVSAGTDDSGIRIAEKFSDKSGFRVYRAGEVTLSLSNIPDELATRLKNAGIDVWSSNRVSVKLNVDTNPDVYLWERTDIGKEYGHDRVSQIFYNETIYDFWNYKVGNSYQGIFVTEFDGESKTDPELIIPSLKLASLSLFDGGGNGYVLLGAEAANGHVTNYILNLDTYDTHQIDNYEGVDFDWIDTWQSNGVYSFTTEGKLNYFSLSTKNSGSSVVVYQYSPDAEAWQEVTSAYYDHGNLTWIQAAGEKESVLLLDTKDLSSGRQPRLHFFSRESGKQSQTVELSAPIGNEGQSCINVTTSGSSHKFQLAFHGQKVSAYCQANISGNANNNEYWLWHDVTEQPVVITRDVRETWAGDAQLNMVANENLQFAFGAQVKDMSGQYLREIHQVDIETNELQRISLMGIEPNSGNTFQMSYSSQHHNYDVSMLSAYHPDIPDEMMVIAYKTLLVRNPETGEWLDDVDMRKVPTSVDNGHRLYQMNGTWVISNKVTKSSTQSYHWRLRLRQPEL